MIVVWDPKKERTNIAKHGISFVEAQTVLESNRQLILETKSDGEDRFIALGFSLKLNLLVVVYCYRFVDVIRIISARKATRKERGVYEKGI
jgi:uncharacterized DUF497 family protein